MTLRQVGEFGLIERVAAVVGRSPQVTDGLVVGIGDDAAVWVQEQAALVATTDMLVEGVHFDLSYTRWGDLGWKALAVNLSDLAAMGAAPGYALVSLGLRPEATVQDVQALYEGMQDLAERTGCRVVGGDTVASPMQTTINVAVVGSVPYLERETVMRRDRGRAGDSVAVTGVLGASAAGLHALRHPDSRQGAAQQELVMAHLRPEPQLEVGRLLREAGVRCAMDVSDGLLADTEKLCLASGAGARLRAEALPLMPVAEALYPAQALEWAAGGGEDFQLLFCAPPEVMERALTAVRATGVRATVIGELTAAQGVRLVDTHGGEMQLDRHGWDHFADGTGA